MKMGITPGVLCPVLGSSVQERLDILERLQRRATKMVMGLEQLTNIGILMVLRPFNLEESRFSKDFICAHEYSQAVCKDRARPFPAVPTDRTRGTGHRLKHRKLPLNIRKHYEGH